ncbi:MAG: hypothetical protein ACPG7P_03755, partial [Candidatus Puniceispirillaceae bacterium]
HPDILLHLRIIFIKDLSFHVPHLLRFADGEADKPESSEQRHFLLKSEQQTQLYVHFLNNLLCWLPSLARLALAGEDYE